MCCRRFVLVYLLIAVASVGWGQEPTAAKAKPQLPAKEKFHLYLLIGQSNMAGRGGMEEPDRVAPPRVLKFSKGATWEPATAPLHFDKSSAGVGLGNSFGQTMAEADAEIVVGLIPCAVGGTPLSRWVQGGDLYQQAVERTRAALKDGTLKGILWHQGESDSGKEETAKSYSERLTGMIGALRKDLAAEEVPFVAGELGEFLSKSSHWRVVNEQLHLTAKNVPQMAVVSAKDLKHKGDVVHFDSPSLREFGRRYAAAMQELQAKGAAK